MSTNLQLVISDHVCTKPSDGAIANKSISCEWEGLKAGQMTVALSKQVFTHHSQHDPLTHSPVLW